MLNTTRFRGTSIGNQSRKPSTPSSKIKQATEVVCSSAAPLASSRCQTSLFSLSKYSDRAADRVPTTAATAIEPFKTFADSLCTPGYSYMTACSSAYTIHTYNVQ